jgi:O-antigen ligase
MNNLEIWWVAIGITLTSATQMRLSSLPIGPGEVMLCIWMLFSLIKVLIVKQHLITPILKYICLFWLVGFTSLTFGLLIADSRNLKSTTWHHDYFAFCFLFVFSICLTNSSFFYSQIQKMFDYVVGFSILSLSTIFLFPSSISFLTPWYEGVRFLGWSQNPNQLALLLCTMPFLAIHILLSNINILSRLKYLILIILCFVIGIATQSDALFFAWIVGFTVNIFLNLYLFITNKFLFKRYIKPEIKIICIAIMVVLSTIILLICVEGSYQGIHSASANVYDEGGQGSLRVTLWKNGLTAIFSSPLFGLGPGAHSGSTAPFLDFEAHNTLIDWGSSSGIVGIIAYISILGWIAWQVWNKQSFIMLSAIVSLMVFSSFHYVLRHPIFWFYLLAINSSTSQNNTSRYQIFKN